MLVGRDEQKLQDAGSELKSDKVLVAAGDIIKEEDVQSIFDRAIGKFGTVDVVVNTAGYRSEGAIGEVPPSEWWKDHVSAIRIHDFAFGARCLLLGYLKSVRVLTFPARRSTSKEPTTWLTTLLTTPPAKPLHSSTSSASAHSAQGRDCPPFPPASSRPSS